MIIGDDDGQWERRRMLSAVETVIGDRYMRTSTKLLIRIRAAGKRFF